MGQREKARGKLFHIIILRYCFILILQYIPACRVDADSVTAHGILVSQVCVCVCVQVQSFRIKGDQLTRATSYNTA